MSNLDFSALKPVDTAAPATPAAQPEQLDFSGLKKPVFNPPLNFKAPDMAPVAKQYELQKSNDLGAPFSLTEGTMKDEGLAFHIGRLMATGDPQSAADAFLSKYPQGDLKQSDGDLFWRESPTDTYKRVGGVASLGEAMTARNIVPLASMLISPGAGTAWRALSFIPKFAEYIGPIASKFPVISAALRLGGETSAGSLADTGINVASGDTADTDLAKELSKASTSGGEAAIATAVTGGLLKTPGAVISAVKAMKGAISGEGTAKAGDWLSSLIMKGADPELMALSKQAEAEGLSPLTQAQVGHPVARAIAGQVGAVSTALRNSKIEQLNNLRTRLQTVVDSNPDSAANGPALQALVDTQLGQIAAEVPLASKLGVSDLGDALQGQIDQTLGNAKQLIAKNMAKAAVLARQREINIPTAPLKSASDEIRRGVLAPGKEGAPPVQLQEIPSVILKDLDKIDQLGENLGNVTAVGKTDTAFDQFMKLRDNWYDLMTSNPDPNVRQMASKLWNSSHEAINGTFGELGTQAFQDARQGALDSFKSYSNLRQVLNGLAQSNTPGRLADTLVQPGRAPILRTLQDAGGLDTVSDGFRTKLSGNLNGAEKTITALQQRDPTVLNLVMPPEEQAAWIGLSKANRSIGSTITADMASGGLEAVTNAQRIAATATKGEIAQFTNATGGYAGPYATSLRNGIYKDVLDKVGDPGGFSKAIDGYLGRQAQLGNVLSSTDVNFLSMLKRYSSVVGAGEREGISSYGGLSAGSQAKVLYDVSGLFRDRAKFALTVMNMVNKDMMARVLARPAGTALIDSAINQGPTPTGLLMLSRSMGLLASNTLRQNNENAYEQAPRPNTPTWNDTDVRLPTIYRGPQ